MHHSSLSPDNTPEQMGWRLKNGLRSSGLRFWLGFVLLNFLLFLPNYLLNYQDASFWPQARTVSQWALQRSNPDSFRLNLEISLLLLLFPLVRRWWRQPARRWYARGLFILYLFTLLYALYESIIRSIFHTPPNFFNDYRFFSNGIGFLLDGLRLQSWQLLLIALIIIAIPVALYQLIRRWIDSIASPGPGRATRWGAAVLLTGLIGVGLWQNQALAQPNSVITSLSAKLIANARASSTAKQALVAYDALQPETVYNYASTTHLFKRPNIYLIFIESYGSVLYKRPHFIQATTELMQQMQARLQSAGWHTESGLSTSPTWGGGSWMAYTSAEFGLHIDAQPQFLTIKEKYSHQPYPSLGRYLQSQGYQYIRLSPIQRQLSPQEQQANQALYGPDRWITFPDLDYQGPLYGWGPSPPDQFSLYKAREIMDAQGDSPRFFFYLTQNSHYPWWPQPPIQTDWRQLDNPKWPSPPPVGEPVSHRDNIAHEREAIRYQWETLSDFILSTPVDENAIFILVGDHQPPRVSRKEDGYETPIHIITRDDDFAQRFEDYGFEPGLVVGDLSADMKHEGLYSLLVKELVDAYGVSTTPIPYLPDGIRLDIPPHTP